MNDILIHGKHLAGPFLVALDLLYKQVTYKQVTQTGDILQVTQQTGDKQQTGDRQDDYLRFHSS